ncbi:hypothetical protein BJ944DRAFT_58838 [Cunninghamella echinulata]|nr:hypothetical protein BJ944DRAFT_58838 [Cunninghamella echinulata]
MTFHQPFSTPSPLLVFPSASPTSKLRSTPTRKLPTPIDWTTENEQLFMLDTNYPPTIDYSFEDINCRCNDIDCICATIEDNDDIEHEAGSFYYDLFPPNDKGEEEQDDDYENKKITEITKPKKISTHRLLRHSTPDFLALYKHLDRIDAYLPPPINNRTRYTSPLQRQHSSASSLASLFSDSNASIKGIYPNSNKENRSCILSTSLSPPPPSPPTSSLNRRHTIMEDNHNNNPTSNHFISYFTSSPNESFTSLTSSISSSYISSISSSEQNSSSNDSSNRILFHREKNEFNAMIPSIVEERRRGRKKRNEIPFPYQEKRNITYMVNSNNQDTMKTLSSTSSSKPSVSTTIREQNYRAHFVKKKSKFSQIVSKMKRAAEKPFKLIE